MSLNVNSVFDAPIPGQSLTQAPGSSPIQQPPKFVHLDDALEFTWAQIHKKKALVKLELMLRNNIPVEALVRTILYQGLLKTYWGVDLALLMFQTVMWQIEAVAKLKGIKCQTFNDDVAYHKFMMSIDKMQEQNQAIAQVQDAPPAKPQAPVSNFKGFF